MNPGPYTPVPWFWTDQYGLKLQLLGSPVDHDELRFVIGSPEDDKFVGIYRRGDRLAAAIGMGLPAKLNKFRKPLENNASWDEAIALIES